VQYKKPKRQGSIMPATDKQCKCLGLRCCQT
jgi:hypothetical protein